MIPNEQSLIDALAQMGVLEKDEHSPPRGLDGRWALMFNSKPIYDILARRHPQARDALVRIVMATHPQGAAAHTSRENLETLVDRIHASIDNKTHYRDEQYQLALRAYAGAPKALPEYDLDMMNMVRNFAYYFQSKQFFMPGDEWMFGAYFNKIFSNPPAAVRGDPDYLNAHTLQMGIVKYRYYARTEYEKENLLRAMADAVDHFWAYHEQSLPVPFGEDDIDRFALIAPTTPELLPLISRLNGIHPLEWTDRAAPIFISALMRGEDYFHVSHEAIWWVEYIMQPALRDALDELFTKRDFSPESVDAVIQNHLAQLGVEGYAEQWVQPVFKICSGDLLCNVVGGYARRFPKDAATIVRLAAKYANEPREIDAFSSLAGALDNDGERRLRRLIHPDARYAAMNETAAKYRAMPKDSDERALVATRLLTSVYRLPPVAVELQLNGEDERIEHWETAVRLVTQPQTMLNPETISAFHRWFKERRKILERTLCD